jgi:murein DD-endopeptidase MepM/ murein hydrolase activator NlpD
MIVTDNKQVRLRLAIMCLIASSFLAIWEYKTTPLPLKHLTPPTSLQVEIAAPSEPLSQVSVTPPSMSLAKRPHLQIIEMVKNKTLETFLLEYDIDKIIVQDALRVLKKSFNVKDFKEGQEITLRFDVLKTGEEVRLVELSFAPSLGNRILMKAQENGIFQLEKARRPLVKKTKKITSIIQTSFLADGLKSGIPAKTLNELIKAFSYDVNFSLDLHPGDKFTVLFETLRDEEANLEGGGDVLYARLDLKDSPVSVFRFAPNGKNFEYYKASGEAIKKEMLATPINGAKMNDGFGMRKHPVLGFTRMHKGVDFTAAPGTPIVSAGKGTVEKMEYHPTYGYYAKIKHNSEFSTLYAHMSRFTKTLKRGKTVDQSEVIGYVGQSGLTTGPHLHFELHQNGVQINPMRIKKMQGGGKLGGKEYKTFLEHKKKIEGLMK